jgi:hypothetical protein
MIRAAPMALLALLSARPAGAQLFCTMPSEPSCIGLLNFSRDRFTFDICRSEVERYRLQVRQYTDCLRDEQEQAVQRLTRVIQRFNACAQSEFC